MKSCPECDSPMCNYKEDIWNEWICWNCGHYESDTPAYKYYSTLFKDIVRNNPSHFIRKFLKRKASDEFLHGKKSDKDFTESKFTKHIRIQIDGPSHVSRTHTNMSLPKNQNNKPKSHTNSDESKPIRKYPLA